METVIDLDIPPHESVLVLNGILHTDTNVQVVVSNSVGAFSNNSPSFINVDPATGMGGTLSSQTGVYYDIWTEMVDDLITAGEYVGNNTDTMLDLWAAGISIGWTTHLCITCPSTLCAEPGQI